jgi:hypothetical protein
MPVCLYAYYCLRVTNFPPMPLSVSTTDTGFHWLMLSESDPDSPMATSLPTRSAGGAVVWGGGGWCGWGGGGGGGVVRGLIDVKVE